MHSSNGMSEGSVEEFVDEGKNEIDDSKLGRHQGILFIDIFVSIPGKTFPT